MGASIDFAVKKEKKLKEPHDYKVIILNDDWTPMDFVVDVLVIVFHKTEEQANRIMIAIHKSGRGIAGTYTLDIAQTKAKQVEALSQQNDYPLQCIVEQA
jgi:ATP-dependent Clp protease adaptor protein ClpS